MYTQLPKKILTIITRLDKGGSPDVALAIAGRLNVFPNEVTLISGHTYDPDGSIGFHIARNKIRHITCESLVREIDPVKDLIAFWQIYRYIKKEKYDIVHTHTSKAGIIGRWAAYFAGVKTIIHMPHGHVFYGYYGKFVSYLFVLAERLTALITDTIITITPKGITDHVAYKIAEKEKFVSIYPGVDISEYLNFHGDESEMRKKLGIDDKAFVVGTVTRLEKVKNNTMLIKAFAQILKEIENSILIIAGDGPESLVLKELARTLGIEPNIKFVGYRNDVPQIMNMFDVFALCSLNEGFGKVFIQAAVLGKPVVATNVGGVESVVLNGKTGLLVKSDDINACAQALLKLARDPSYAKRLGDNAKEWVTSLDDGLPRFSEELMLRKIEDLYRLEF